MQRSEIDDEVGRLLGDPNHDRWSADTIHARIEFAQQEIQALTGAIKTSELLTPTADTSGVTVDPTVLDITSATWTDPSGNITPLTFRSLEDLDFYRPNWRNEGSQQPDTISYDSSTRQVILVPAPSADDITANCLSVMEVQIPDALAGDSSEPFDGNALMKAYSMSVVHWVVAQCCMDDGTPEALGKAKFHKSNDMDHPGEYEKVIRKINAKLKSPSAIPDRIKWYPQGGLRGGFVRSPNHSNPFA